MSQQFSVTSFCLETMEPFKVKRNKLLHDFNSKIVASSKCKLNVSIALKLVGGFITFKNSGGSPEELLIVIGPHDPDQLQRSLTGQNDQLGLLISVGQYLKTVRDDGQELDVVPLQQGNHLWDTSGKPDGILRPFLVQEEVVQGGDCVEEHTLYWRREQLDQGVDASGFEDGQKSLTVVAQVVKSSNGYLRGLLKCLSHEVVVKQVENSITVKLKMFSMIHLRVPCKWFI